MSEENDELSLFLFIDNPATLHQNLQIRQTLYTKVEDCTLRNHRYVLLKVQGNRRDSLQLFRNIRGREWKTACIYYFEADIWHFEDDGDEVMHDVIYLIGEYRQKMKMFE